MDCFYMSIPNAEVLLTIPEESKMTRDQEPFSMRVFWEKKKADVDITSYDVPTSKSVYNILILTTTRPLLGVTKNDRKKKQAIIRLDCFTKGGQMKWMNALGNIQQRQNCQSGQG